MQQFHLLTWIQSGFLQIITINVYTIKGPLTVTSSFPFTDCGTQSMVANEKITYSVIKSKQNFKTGVIFRDTLFHLTVRCSFSLIQMIQRGIAVQQSKLHYPSALNSMGILGTEMRFTKGQGFG